MIGPLISRKELLISFLLAIFFTLFISLFGSQHHTFSTPEDNISNISSAFLFRHVGLSIYKKPIESFVHPLHERDPSYPTYTKPEQFFSFEQTDVPLYFVWPNVSRPYPLGAWLWYYPYSSLVFDFKRPIGEATLLASFTFLLCAHICFFIFLNLFRFNMTVSRSWSQKLLELIILFFCYTNFIFWSGQGQYDLIAMIPLLYMIKAYRLDQYPLTLFLYGIALFFHFRVLFLLGLTLICIFKFFSQSFNKRLKNLNTTNVILFLGSILLGLLGATIFYWNAGDLVDTTIYERNKYHISKLGSLDLFKLIYFLIVNWGIILYFILRRNWTISITLLMTNIILLASPLVQDWYVMFLFPIFLLLDRRNKYFYYDLFMIFLSYVFISSTYLAESPFSFKFIKIIVQSFST